MTPDQQLHKHSVTIRGHATSIALEDAFWEELKRIAKSRDLSLAGLIAEIDEQRTGGLASALRVYVLERIRRERDGPA